MQSIRRSKQLRSVETSLRYPKVCRVIGHRCCFSRTYIFPTLSFRKKPSLLVLPYFKVCFQVDANSYFYDFSPLGTQAYASGVLAMLEVINLLKPHADALGNTSVVFIAFDGVRIVCHLHAFDCLLSRYCDILNLSSVHRSSTITPDLCAWCMRCHRASFLQIPPKWEDTWLHWT